VSNQNNQAVTATSVSAYVPAGYVLAACQGGRFPISIPAGGSILCAFNATLTDPAGSQGSVSAVVASTFGPSTSAVAVPYSLDAPTTAQGACAVLSDAITSRPSLAAGGLSVTGSRAYSDKAQPVCQDTSYNVTARFGPFGENDCNMYTVRGVGCALSSVDCGSVPVASVFPALFCLIHLCCAQACLRTSSFLLWLPQGYFCCPFFCWQPSWHSNYQPAQL
jgi:hypothetical protein